MYILSQLELKTRDVSIVGIFDSEEDALKQLLVKNDVNGKASINFRNNKYECYEINEGILYNSKTLQFIYQINYIENDKY